MGWKKRSKVEDKGKKEDKKVEKDGQNEERRNKREKKGRINKTNVLEHCRKNVTPKLRQRKLNLLVFIHC